MTTVIEKKGCRFCSTKFDGKVLLDFGNQAIVDFLAEGEEGRGRSPLQLVSCPECSLVQLRHTVDADTLYRKFYYRSSINEQMRAALSDVVKSAMKKVVLQDGDAVCDIGSNDGQLLMQYPSHHGLRLVGFEPAEELVKSSAMDLEALGKNFGIVPGYFNAVEALDYSGRQLYKIVTAIAMFYDLDDPVDFLNDVRTILHPEGVFVVQMNYLGLMLRNLTFDNISHEHLCYYSLSVLKEMFEKAGLEIFDVELNAVNGGSIRVYASHYGLRDVEDSVNDGLMEEAFTLTVGAMKNFAEKTRAVSGMLLNFLKEMKKAGKKVYAYGASTRGSAMLQYIFREDQASDYIIAAAERDERKYGKKMAGLGIPIIPEQEARERADYMLVLPYSFWKSIQQRERDWMKAGGKFILPLPYQKVVRLESIGLVTEDLQAELATVHS